MPSSTTFSTVEGYTRLNAVEWGGLVVIVLGGIWLRARPLSESLWIDELHTAWAAAGNLVEVVPRASLGNQSPLYPWLVWITTKLLGTSEATVRLISFLAGVALIPTGFLVGKRWSQSNDLGLLVAFLIAIDPHSIYFSQEARPYALVQWVSLLQIATFARLSDPASRQPLPRDRLLLIGLTTLLFYLHYTSLLLIAGELVYLGIAYLLNWVRVREVIVPRLVELVAVGAATIPAWTHLLQIAARRGNWARFVPQQSLGQLYYLFRFDAFVVIPGTICLVLLGIAWLRGKRWSLTQLIVRSLLLTGCCLMTPLLLAWWLTDWDLFRLFFRRYLMGMATLPMVFAGLLGSFLPKWAGGRWIYAAVVSICAVGVLFPMQPALIDGIPHWHTQEDWRAAIAFVNQQETENHWPVFVRSGLIEDDQLRTESPSAELRAYCLFPIGSLYRLEARSGAIEPLPSTESWQLNEQQRSEIVESEGAWIVVRGSEDTVQRMARQLVDWLQRHDIHVQLRRWAFGHVGVLRVSVR